MPVTVNGHKAEIPKVLGGNLSQLIYINPNLTYSADILFNPFPVTEKKKVTTFVIYDKISCVLTEPTLRIFNENTLGWLQLK